LQLLRAARTLRAGGLVAHHTATLPGVAAAADNRRAAERLARFKQRRGPFLLLADSMHRALSLLVWQSPMLRRMLQHSWPGPSTFVLPAAGRALSALAAACFAGRNVAVRVDTDPASRLLARVAGGLLISSSLNRRGGPVQHPGLRLRMRWHRHLSATLAFGEGSGHPSGVFKYRNSRLHVLRTSPPASN